MNEEYNNELFAIAWTIEEMNWLDDYMDKICSKMKESPETAMLDNGQLRKDLRDDIEMCSNTFILALGTSIKEIQKRLPIIARIAGSVSIEEFIHSAKEDYE
tara:strand:- start:341 stop:646 length:306 start_codon:yes stop_codon:yes gene_type:complete